MIISHKHRYLFIEVPHTATTAISKELRENYDGIPILQKHARYAHFWEVATDEEKKYFTFSCIRNPLDSEVSKYFMFKTDHRNRYGDSKNWKKSRATPYELFRYNWVKNNEATFADYFKRFYFFPYDNWTRLSHRGFDFVIRYENLQEDFATAFSLLGIEQKRPLPLINKTGEKKRDFSTYYTPDIRKRAKRVFGPYMKEWGYEFPPEWGDLSVSWPNQAAFDILGLVRWKVLPRLRFVSRPIVRMRMRAHIRQEAR